jgi:hypothetical protein
VVDDARHILAWIRRREGSTFTKRDAFDGVKSRFHRVEAMEPGLSLLVAHGYIRERVHQQAAGRGRPPSPVFEVNPASHKSHKSHKSEGEGISAISAICAPDLETVKPEACEDAEEREVILL